MAADCVSCNGVLQGVRAARAGVSRQQVRGGVAMLSFAFSYASDLVQLAWGRVAPRFPRFPCPVSCEGEMYAAT